MESLILALSQKLNNLEDESLLNSQTIKNLARAQKFTLQKIGVVRYSPFAEPGGGNYSFSLALLDAHNNSLDASGGSVFLN